MTCPTCRPSDLGYVAFHELAEAHTYSGLRQSQCPGCGLWRWPWECPEPEWEATGLRWVWDQESLWWRLKLGNRSLGVVWRSHVHRKSYRATYPLVEGGAHCHRTLSKAARRLVAEVRRG